MHHHRRRRRRRRRLSRFIQIGKSSEGERDRQTEQSVVVAAAAVAAAMHHLWGKKGDHKTEGVDATDCESLKTFDKNGDDDVVDDEVAGKGEKTFSSKRGEKFRRRWNKNFFQSSLTGRWWLLLLLLVLAFAHLILAKVFISLSIVAPLATKDHNGDFPKGWDRVEVRTWRKCWKISCFLRGSRRMRRMGLVSTSTSTWWMSTMSMQLHQKSDSFFPRSVLYLVLVFFFFFLFRWLEDFLFKGENKESFQSEPRSRHRCRRRRSCRCLCCLLISQDEEKTRWSSLFLRLQIKNVLTLTKNFSRRWFLEKTIKILKKASVSRLKFDCLE